SFTTPNLKGQETRTATWSVRLGVAFPSFSGESSGREGDWAGVGWVAMAFDRPASASEAAPSVTKRVLQAGHWTRCPRNSSAMLTFCPQLAQAIIVGMVLLRREEKPVREFASSSGPAW